MDELQIYVKDMVQSPFGFLMEIMHLAANIAGDSGTLPQVTWLGKNEYQSLAIHGKKVELNQLRSLCQKLMKDMKKKFNSKIIREIVRLRVTSLRDRSRDVEKHFLATINKGAFV